MDERQVCSACHGVGCGWIDISSKKLVICSIEKRRQCLEEEPFSCMCKNCNGSGKVSWINNLFMDTSYEEYYFRIKKFLDKYKISINTIDKNVIDILNLREDTIITKNYNFIEILYKDGSIPYEKELPRGYYE